MNIALNYIISPDNVTTANLSLYYYVNNQVIEIRDSKTIPYQGQNSELPDIDAFLVALEQLTIAYLKKMVLAEDKQSITIPNMSPTDIAARDHWKNTIEAEDFTLASIHTNLKINPNEQSIKIYGHNLFNDQRVNLPMYFSTRGLEILELINDPSTPGRTKWIKKYNANQAFFTGVKAGMKLQILLENLTDKVGKI